MKAPALFDAGELPRGISKTAGAAALPLTVSRRPVRSAPTVFLNCGSLMSRPLQPGETVRVSVTDGHAWITMEGDARDYVLTSNDQHDFAGPGLLVIEGVQRGARIQMECV